MWVIFALEEAGANLSQKQKVNVDELRFVKRADRVTEWWLLRTLIVATKDVWNWAKIVVGKKIDEWLEAKVWTPLGIFSYDKTLKWVLILTSFLDFQNKISDHKNGKRWPPLPVHQGLSSEWHRLRLSSLTLFSSTIGSTELHCISIMKQDLTTAV